MANLTVGANAGSMLTQLLMCEDLQPGDPVSYQQAKNIFAYHPVGAKMVDTPLKMAQSQGRTIVVTDGPEERVVRAFNDAWKRLRADQTIFNTCRIARIYGIGSVIYGDPKYATDKPIPPRKLADCNLYFNVLDPLNTSGSLTFNQDPNSPDYQRPMAVSIAGKAYHPSRSCTILNEDPLYIEWTTSAFGYVGRSVYQRALYPLKTFISSMVTDDLVITKSGVFITKIKQVGSIIDQVMATIGGIKRNIVREAKTGNVISVNIDEAVETLNMQNVEVYIGARKNALENIAAAADMPAILLNSETFAGGGKYGGGFGEGTEDAKNVSRYVDEIRRWMQPLYDFFDPIVMRVAWSEEFFEAIKNDFPEYRKMPYETAFYRWKNSFSAEWPSLLTEPESELAKVEDIKFKAVIAVAETLLPHLDAENAATLITWITDSLNNVTMLFPNPLVLDPDLMAAHFQQVEDNAKSAADAAAAGAASSGDTEDNGEDGIGKKQPNEPKPFAAAA